MKGKEGRFKVVLITDGSSGIGAQLALVLMEKGIRVYAASRRLALSRKSPSGGEIIPIQIDVNRETDIQAALDHILTESGRLDAVVCNAGNGIAGAIEDFTSAEVRAQFETNFFGAVKTIQACLPLFRQQGYGKIMATSSLAAMIPIPYQSFYFASKAALTLFMQALSIETKPFGIQCCTVFPGDTKTEFTQVRKYCRNAQSPTSPYRQRMHQAVSRMETDEKNGMKAQYVATQMYRQLLRSRMKTEVIPGYQYHLIYGLYVLLPKRLRLWALSKIY